MKYADLQVLLAGPAKLKGLLVGAAYKDRWPRKDLIGISAFAVVDAVLPAPIKLFHTNRIVDVQGVIKMSSCFGSTTSLKKFDAHYKNRFVNAVYVLFYPKLYSDKSYIHYVLVLADSNFVPLEDEEKLTFRAELDPSPPAPPSLD